MASILNNQRTSSRPSKIEEERGTKQTPTITKHKSGLNQSMGQTIRKAQTHHLN